MAKRYLGDGVYIDNDGYMLTLTTESNAIHLEPQVLDALLTYLGAERTAEDPDGD